MGNYKGSLRASTSRTNGFVPTPIVRKSIQIVPEIWSNENLKFWSKYNIKEDILEKYNVKSISQYSVEKCVFGSTSLNYSYSFRQNCASEFSSYKIYRPYEKNFKWISNCSADIIQGLEQVEKSGDLLIITKSLKDVMVLYSLGYQSIAPQNEKIVVDPKKLGLDYKRVLVLFDNDKAGKEGASKYPYPAIFMPEDKAKDVSDYIKLYGVENTKQLLCELTS